MKKHTSVIIGLALLLASATQASQQQLAKSIQDAHLETSRTIEQLKSTLGALNELTAQKKGDLRPAYDAFCAQIPKTEAVAAQTRNRVRWMAGDGRKYFKDWQDTINGIADESLRKKAEKRMHAVKASYEKVEVSLVQTGDKFRPFLSDLTDIKKALSTDVTAGGVKSIKSNARSANWNLQYVDKAAKAALKEMDKMQKALSSKA